MESAKSKRIRRLVCRMLLPFALLGMVSAAHAALAISQSPTSNVTCSAGTCTATAPDAVLNVTKLTHLLHQGDTQVVSGVAQAIDIEAPFAWTESSRLTLSAPTGITVAQTVAVQGAGAVTLTTSDTSAGAIAFVRGGKLDFWSVSNGPIVNGHTYVLVNDVSTLVSAIATNPNGFFALAGDYDAGADRHYKASPIYVLYGSPNGLGHTIANLKIASPENCAGFISYLVGGTAPTVSNLALSRIDLSQTQTDNQHPPVGVGGLAGCSQGAVSHVRVTGRVKGADSAIAGGIVGWQADGGGGTPTISDTSTDVVVSGGGQSTLGGIAGFDYYGDLVRCATTGKIQQTSGGGYAGGLVGLAQGMNSIADSWSSARVIGAQYAGGLAGWLDISMTVSDNYATGTVSAAAAGGLVGNNAATGNQSSSILRSYARGAVSGAAPGGVIGADAGTNAHANVYWDLKTSGISNPAQGAGNIPNDPGITGLTHAQMKAALPAGFDPLVWGQNAAINHGYPYLLANPPPQ